MSSTTDEIEQHFNMSNSEYWAMMLAGSFRQEQNVKQHATSTK